MSWPKRRLKVCVHPRAVIVPTCHVKHGVGHVDRCEKNKFVSNTVCTRKKNVILREKTIPGIFSARNNIKQRYAATPTIVCTKTGLCCEMCHRERDTFKSSESERCIVPTCDVKRCVGQADRREENRCFPMCGINKKLVLRRYAGTPQRLFVRTQVCVLRGSS